MKILNFLNRPFIKGLIKSIPIIGDVADNVLTETSKSPAGQMDKEDLVYKLVRLALLIGLMYLVFSGKLSMDQAEGAKDFIDA